MCTILTCRLLQEEDVAISDHQCHCRGHYIKNMTKTPQKITHIGPCRDFFKGPVCLSKSLYNAFPLLKIDQHENDDYDGVHDYPDDHDHHIQDGDDDFDDVHGEHDHD